MLLAGCGDGDDAATAPTPTPTATASPEDDVRDITTAATVVGDDFQRNQAGAELAPETWTHGSSAQRVQWVMTGLQQGLPSACDTFQ